MAFPALPPLFQKLGTVPVPDLLAEAVLASLAHSQHDMGVRLGLAVCSDIAVDVAVGDHAESDILLANELPGQVYAPFWTSPARVCELYIRQEEPCVGKECIST